MIQSSYDELKQRITEQVDKNTGQRELAQIDDFFKRLEAEAQKLLPSVIQRFKANLEKIDLTLLYLINELHEEFDQTFRRLRAEFDQHKTEISQNLKVYNNLTYLDLDYVQQRAKVQKTVADFLEFVDTEYTSVTTEFDQMLENQVDSVRFASEALVGKQIQKLTDSLAPLHERMRQHVVDHMLKRVGRDVIEQILHLIEQPPALISAFPDTVFFKTCIRSCVSSIQEKAQGASGVFSLGTFVLLADLARDFVESDDGLFHFSLQYRLFPNQYIFSRLSEVDDYFQLYPSDVKFTSAEFLQGLQKQLLTIWNDEIEANFFAFVRQFYYKESQEKHLPALISRREGTLARQKLYVDDVLHQDFDLCFVYFYMAIVGLMNNCELVPPPQQTEHMHGTDIAQQVLFG